MEKRDLILNQDKLYNLLNKLLGNEVSYTIHRGENVAGCQSYSIMSNKGHAIIHIVITNNKKYLKTSIGFNCINTLSNFLSITPQYAERIIEKWFNDIHNITEPKKIKKFLRKKYIKQ